MTDIGAYPYVPAAGPTIPAFQLRGLAWHRFSDLGQLGESTAFYDTGGGALNVWAFSTDVPCRIDPLTTNETTAAGRISDRSTHVVTCPAGIPVTTENRFVITGRGTFEVTAVRTRTDDPATFFEAVEVS